MQQQWVSLLPLCIRRLVQELSENPMKDFRISKFSHFFAAILHEVRFGKSKSLHNHCFAIYITPNYLGTLTV